MRKLIDVEYHNTGSYPAQAHRSLSNSIWAALKSGVWKLNRIIFMPHRHEIAFHYTDVYDYHKYCYCYEPSIGFLKFLWDEYNECNEGMAYFINHYRMTKELYESIDRHYLPDDAFTMKVWLAPFVLGGKEDVE